ncbi:MAG: GNAT family N-acetyltransferase [Bacteroidota bacterium]
MSAFEIKSATLHDVVAIALLGRVTFNETFGHLFRDKNDLLRYHERTYSIDKIEQSLQKPDNLFWIATVDRLPVAYAKLKLHSPTPFIANEHVCQLQKIYVLRDFLSMKIGYELQHQMIDKAAELGFEHIWLSVLNSNLRAIRFYEQNSFEQVGEHKFQIGIEAFDFHAMARPLN